MWVIADMTDMLGVATSSGIRFGPNSSGKFYLCLYYHRGNNRPEKNKWHPEIKPQLEYQIFCNTDRENWYDRIGHGWGMHNQGDTIIGFQGERLCKFPRTSNESDPRHGFPVSPMENGDDDTPSDEFIEHWILMGAISKTFGRRIQRRKV